MTLSRRSEISVRRVRSLLAVVSNRSFSAAAAELGLTQPAVSQHVRQLEEQLGVPLLQRDAEGLRLSAAGAALMAGFRRLVASNVAIVDQLQSIAEGSERIVRVAAPASTAALFLAPAFKALRDDFPGHILDVCEIDDEEAFAQIRSRDIDFGFSSVFVPAPGLAFEPMIRDGACIAVAADGPLAGRRGLSPEGLLAWPVVRFPVGTTSNDWLQAVAEAAGRTPRVVCEVRQLVTGLQMVAQGLGVAVLPEASFHACRLPGLVALALEGLELQRTIGLVMRDDHHPTAFESALIDRVRALARPSPDGRLATRPIRPISGA